MPAPPPPSAFDFPPEYVAADKGPVIIATIVTVTVLETLFTAARLYVRGGIMKKLQLDDYIIILAVLCGWGAVTFGIKAAQAGNGKHFLVLENSQKSEAILWTIVGFCPGVMSFGLPKLAAVHLLTRLMNPGRTHKIFLWFLGIVANLSLLGCVVILFAQCKPVESQWDFSIQGKCIDKWVLVHYAMFAGGMSAGTDLYLAAYPAFVLFGLQIPRRKKIALSGALGIGSIATVVAIYKTTRLPSLASDDFSYHTSDLVIWTCVEGSTIIIASCIPVLQPLADRIWGRRLFGSSYGARNYKNYGSSRSGKLQSDIELSYQARKRTVKDPNGLTFLDQTQMGSEETILQSKGGENRGTGDDHSGQQPPDALNPGSRGIVRTDVISVSHSSESQHTADGPTYHHGGRPF
ncbi:related to integral membrane protein PTH11 [Cephalotrichum gorgonifer]|uniref:Related to integral membrane protein PTH11 n=1 Tax=Cephalotrichum gorgonifer TaxID=2041049 RepID=A0AAE8N6D9_9PEZI|nr:related to integral membrane protein PTH11 [Cephalotrichum gorgonifer]